MRLEEGHVLRRALWFVGEGKGGMLRRTWKKLVEGKNMSVGLRFADQSGLLASVGLPLD